MAGSLIPVYETENRLKSALDTNQQRREQLCVAVLQLDKRFSDVRPRHPKGGPDGGRDIEAFYKGSQLTFGAVGFVNGANDSKEQKKEITKKFKDDLKRSLQADKKPEVFVFFTNILFTVGEKRTLETLASAAGFSFSDIFDRERIRILLDSPDGLAARYQYLQIPLSDAEQAAFFSRWGDDIQSVVATGFRAIERTLNRVVFLQETANVLDGFYVHFQMKRKFSAEEIGHFRAFGFLTLKEPKRKIFQIFFGSTDKYSRFSRAEAKFDPDKDRPGIKHGVASGAWESYWLIPPIEGDFKKFDGEVPHEDDEEAEGIDRFIQVRSGSSIGMDEIEFLYIGYEHDLSLFRYMPRLSLMDLSDASFLPFVNKSFGEKVKSVHVYANGYKLMEIPELHLDDSSFDDDFPGNLFSEEELKDPWVRLRPPNGTSAFILDFFSYTPKRLFAPTPTLDSLEGTRRRRQ